MKIKNIVSGLVCASILSGCASGNIVAKYPDTVKYSDERYEAWFEDRQTFLDQYDGYNEGMDAFYKKVNTSFFKEEKNRTVSPLNLYMALSMLASMSQGETQQQILSILDVDAEHVAQKAQALWLANYIDDGIATCKLNDSLWLNEEESYDRSLLEKISKEYYASIYQGKMGSEAFDRQLQDWMNENTGDLLRDSIEDIHLDPDQFMSLVSTLYFKGAWRHPFDQNENIRDTFYGKQEQEVEFMHQTLQTSYVDTETYQAIALPIESAGALWIVLPKQDLASVWKSEPVQETEYAEVDLTLPKFDLQNTLSIKEMLEEMGMVDAFIPGKANFSPLSDQDIYVSKAEHGVRVVVEEEGIEAAAYTMMSMDTTALFDRQIEMRVDRPFIFALCSEDGSLLLTGQVVEVDPVD